MYEISSLILALDGGGRFGAGGGQRNASAIRVPIKETWELAAGSMWTQRTRKLLATFAGTGAGAFGHPADRHMVPSVLQTEVTC
jgi:hypothetical protein